VTAIRSNSAPSRSARSRSGVNAHAIVPRLGEVRAVVPELALEIADEFVAAVVGAMPPRPANYETVIAVNAGAHPYEPELETGGNSCSAR
jgi:hypothetical protein